jgi:hypothetical protein
MQIQLALGLTCALGISCSATTAETTRAQNPSGEAPKASPQATACPKLPPPPPGQCRANEDCSGAWVECAWGAPPPRPRATGSGALFGMDGQQCRHGYRQQALCPAGQAFQTRPAANLCPEAECVPRCTASSCATDEHCDAGSGLCRPIPCTGGWPCSNDALCRYGTDADAHGCAPRCPGYGKCVVYGPPSP